MSKRFIIATDDIPHLLCYSEGGRSKTKVRFHVENGAWSGVLDTATGELTVNASGHVFRGCRILDLGPLPDGSYQKVLEWAKAKMKETA